MQLYTSSCNHELLAPLRCVIEIASSLLEQSHPAQTSLKLRVIFNTASFLLNQVQANMDQGLLSNNKLIINLAEHKLIEDVVSPVIDIFRL